MFFVYCTGIIGPAASDYNKRLILLSVIRLSGRHCFKHFQNTNYYFTLRSILKQIFILFTLSVKLNNILFRVPSSEAHSRVHNNNNNYFFGSDKPQAVLIMSWPNLCRLLAKRHKCLKKVLQTVLKNVLDRVLKQIIIKDSYQRLFQLILKLVATSFLTTWFQ